MIRKEQKTAAACTDKSLCVSVCVCVFTVEALLVDYGTAGQGFVVLLVAHQGVHTEDGWKTTREMRVRGRHVCRGDHHPL